MKLLSVLAIGVFTLWLVQPGLAQSTPSTAPVTTATTATTTAKRQEQDNQAKAKAKKDHKQATRDKKISTGQAAATAAAYKEGIIPK